MTRPALRTLALLLAAMAATACSETLDPAAGDPVDGENDDFGTGGAAALTGAEEAGVLLLVNTASLPELDDAVGLDRRAATNIVNYRNGADGRLGTVDDNPFDSLEELDAIPYVGAVALDLLFAYASAQGLIEEDVAADACLIISEYMEGQGNYNKVVELYNCGSEPLELSDYGLCLVRNADTDCTFSTRLNAGTLAPGAVFTACRSKTGTFNDPFQPIRDNCQQDVAGVATFSGDDRIVVFHDANGSGRWEPASDGVMDMLGRFTWRPSTEIWADVNLRRCRLEPYDGTTFYDHTDWFTSHTRHSFDSLGVAPVAGCP